MYNPKWSQLTSLQLGKYAEYFVKMEFTQHGFDVYTSEVDDRGIDFIVCTTAPRKYYDIQVKSARRNASGGFNYIFFRQEHFKLRENLYAVIVLLVDGEHPKLYMVPSTVWHEPNSLFVRRDYEPPKKSKPEWGFSLSKKNLSLLENYSFEETVETLK
ncbi:MAG: DUF4365 domain-containing protein [Rubrobacter sp.]|nr:DUF4365 domain-containing protein [Rubrobacter sp.]